MGNGTRNSPEQMLDEFLRAVDEALAVPRPADPADERQFCSLQRLAINDVRLAVIGVRRRLSRNATGREVAELTDLLRECTARHRRLVTYPTASQGSGPL